MMINSFHETSRKELDFVDVETNGEPLNFSAFDTFDSLDCREQKESGDRYMHNVSIRSNASVEYRDNSEGSDNAISRARESQTSVSPALDISPLSSISRDDSFPEPGTPISTDVKANQMSIFRRKEKPYVDDQYKKSKQYPFKPRMHPKTTSAEKDTGTRGNNMMGQNYNNGNQYRATRQVSVSVGENQNFTSRKTFDAFGGDVRNLVPVDSMMGQEETDIKPHPLAGSTDINHPHYYDRMNQNREMTMSYQSSSLPQENHINTITGEIQDSVVVTPRKHFKQSNINYLMVLQPRSNLFSEFTFLLPGLKMYVSTYLANKKHEWSGYHKKYEYVIAKRRLVCAVQAYGGNMPRLAHPMQQKSVSSVFRFKVEDHGTRGKYDELLHNRYYENNSHLSWDVEENPPISRDVMGISGMSRADERSQKMSNMKDESDNKEMAQIDASKSNDYAATGDSNERGNSKNTTKMRYRCKLCGQPKQNHTCPYQQALQRSIGTMSYPALNAFQSQELGHLAPALSEMNNFTDLENDDDFTDGPTRPDDCVSANTLTETQPKPKRPFDSISGVNSLSSTNSSQKISTKRRKTRIPNGKKVDKIDKYEGDDKLFHPVMDIKPEQYRLVSVRATNQLGDFKYPTLPLSFHQRKNASEELFGLCQEVAGLSEECAEVLQVARESNSWDLAVAELLTQILVMMHCPLGDESLEGLRRHLETLGFSC